jgi:hypothetical protein
VATAGWQGQIGVIASSSTVFVFAGPTALVTSALGQRLTASGAAVIAFHTGAGNNVQLYNIDLCYQSSTTPDAPLLNFNPESYLNPALTTTRTVVAVAGTVVPSTADTWNVGVCINNYFESTDGSFNIDNNDYSKGWVQVTN